MNIPDIGIVGQNKVIEELISAVFEPRQLSAVTRRELGNTEYVFSQRFEFAVIC